MHPLASRLLPSQRSDVVLMVLFLVPSVAQVLLDPIASRPVGLAYAVMSVLPLAWRRRIPAMAAVVGSAAWPIPTEGYLYLGYVIAVILFFTAGTLSPLPTLLLVGTWGLTVGTISTLRGPDEPVAVLGAWLVVLGSLTGGRILAHQRSQTRQLELLTGRLERERALVARTAVVEERGRIARELHDVLGHEVTLIAIQSEAAASALRSSPDLAYGPIEAIRETAHKAGAEMRSLLGLLDADGHDDVPIPGPTGLADLAARARDLGIDNSLTVTGEPWDGQQRVWLAVNRIVQEMLTNAGRHAPGAGVSVTIAWADSAVVVSACNPVTGPVGPPGFGILGMTERARLLGGTLAAEPTPTGGFEVVAALPRQPEATP